LQRIKKPKDFLLKQQFSLVALWRERIKRVGERVVKARQQRDAIRRKRP